MTEVPDPGTSVHNQPAQTTSVAQPGHFMSPSGPRLANFVIGGTEKAGTTSVFNYLSAHPQVCTSSRKETDFFRQDLTSDRTADAERYASLFEHCDPQVPVFLEASPGYLGEAASVAPRMRALVRDAKVLFILRDPIDRLYSTYHFHRGRLNLPESMTFDDYVNRCIDFDRRVKGAAELGLDEWYLKALRFGCYADFLAIFRSQLSVESVKVMFFEALREDEQRFMVELSAFLGIDPDFWSSFRFRKSNVTFSGRNRPLHRLAMRVNSIAEPLMRRHPGLKRSIVRAYKAVNQEREGYDPMPPSVRARLISFYGPGVRTLQRQLDTALPEAWRYLTDETASA
jgi:Sulfotransferase domain